MMRILVVLLLLSTACMDDDDFSAMPTEEPTPPPSAATQEITFLALGDSYTIGTAVEESERWTVQLAAALPQDSFAVTTLDIVAVNGWTTTDLKNGIRSRSQGLRPAYDLVSLLIGVNNQFQGGTVAAYAREFEDLLQTAIAFATEQDTNRVFVVSIPDYAFTPFGGGRSDISEELVLFNATAKEITERYGIPFYNITPISQEGLAQPDLVADDRLHPSGKQYTRWVNEVLLAPVLGQLGG